MAPTSQLPAIRACLFDMDGLLIDSEDLYTICTNEVLHEYGKGDLPWSIKAQLQGRPGPEATRIFDKWAQLPISNEELVTKTDILKQKYFPTTQPLPGVPSLLHTLSSTSPPHKVHIALATSSNSANYKLKTTHLQDLFSAFPDENKVLGDDKRIPSGRGKPAPDIYLLALETINARLRREGDEKEITPAECLVFEDSVPGVEAGRRAGMQVVWCPHPGLLQEYKGREGDVLAGIAHLDVSEEEERRKQMGKGDSGTGVEGQRDRPGRVDDGYGRLFGTLEDFPYADYGMKV